MGGMIQYNIFDTTISRYGAGSRNFVPLGRLRFVASDDNLQGILNLRGGYPLVFKTSAFTRFCHPGRKIHLSTLKSYTLQETIKSECL